MKNLLLITMLLIVGKCFAQKKTVTLSKSKIGTVECSYNKTIDLSTSDTTAYVSIIFKNEKYKLLNDYESIFFLTSEDAVFDFTKDLKKAYEEMGKKSNISWSKARYSINLYDFASSLFLGQGEKGSAYTTLNKNQVKKIIDWLEINGFAAKS